MNRWQMEFIAEEKFKKEQNMNNAETQALNIPVVRHSFDMITEEYVYKNEFRFQRTMTHGIWFVTYQNYLITFGQYRHDLEQWIDSNYA